MKSFGGWYINLFILINIPSKLLILINEWLKLLICSVSLTILVIVDMLTR